MGRAALGVFVITGTILGIVWWLKALFAAPVKCPEIRPPVTVGSVIHVSEDYSRPFVAESGDTVNVILRPDGDPEQRCADSGGVFDVTKSGILVCENVDF